MSGTICLLQCSPLNEGGKIYILYRTKLSRPLPTRHCVLCLKLGLESAAVFNSASASDKFSI